MNTATKKWADIVTIIHGKNQKSVQSLNGKYPIYGSGGVIGRADDYLCPAGTTIIGRKGTINNPILVNEPFWNVDTAFGVLPGNELLPEYLFYFCCLFNFKSLDKSTTIPSLAKKDLLNISMPVPDLKQQQIIVMRIEELVSELDKAVETLKTVKEQLAVYRQAVLKEAFLSVQDKALIKDVSSFVTSGSRGWAKYYSSSGARFIRITDLTRDSIHLKTDDIQYVLLPDKAEGKRSRLKPNDVLISITADLGSIALVPAGIQEAYVNQHIAMVRFNNPSQGRFFAWYLKSDIGHKDLLKNKRGGGKMGLGLDDIRNTPVPVVSDAEANAIIRQIDDRMSACDDVEETVDKALRQSGAMRKSILKKAFEGNLI